ncbi:MAG: ATP-binding protein [Pseudomonadota bacterium]
MNRLFGGIRGKLLALALLFAGAIGLISLLMIRAFADAESISRVILTEEAARSRELAALGRAVGSLAAGKAKLRRDCAGPDVERDTSSAIGVIERQLSLALDPQLDQAARQLVAQSRRLIDACRDIAARLKDAEQQETRLLAALDDFEESVGRAIITETLANRNVDGLRQALATSGSARGHILVASRKLASYLATSRNLRVSQASVEKEYLSALLGLRTFTGVSGALADKRAALIRGIGDQQLRVGRLMEAMGGLESTFDESLASEQQVGEAVRILDELSRSRVEALNSELRQRFGSAANRLLVLVLLAGLLIAVLLVWIFRRGIQVPVERILRIVRSIQAGQPMPAVLPIGDRDLETISDALRKMATEVNDALESLRTASAEKSHFIAVMSHELRNPMNSILALSQSLHEHESSPEERRVLAGTVYNAARTLVSLLNDLLDVGRIESGKLSLSDEGFRAGRLVEEVLAIYRPMAQQKGIGLKARFDIDPDTVYRSDPVRIRQMLVNLVSNAVKFTDSGEVRVEVKTTGSSPQGDRLEFAVIDTGPGVPEEKRDLLFRPFSQVDSSVTRRFGGTGLGLWIVRNVAEALGGLADYSSVEGQGARFWFQVPVRAGGTEQPMTSLPSDDDRVPASLSGEVLVVDDAEANRLVCSLLLTRLGVGVRQAIDGADALEALATGGSPDLILMDLQMPGMDGLEATRQIRRREAEQGSRRVPIVALTANAQASTDAECRAAGMDGVLSKPITRQALAREAGRWLRNARSAPVAESPANDVLPAPR